MFEDADLRKLLTNFRETVISAHSPADLTSRKVCILRRGMIDHRHPAADRRGVAARA